MPERQNTKSLRRAYNKALILNCIRTCGPVSRTQIRTHTRLRMASITELVRELVEAGLVIEAGMNGAGRGRKQVLLRVNAGHGLAVGVEFDADHVIALIADLDMAVVARHIVEFPLGQDKDAILAKLIEGVRDVILSAGIDRARLIGIGIADPGLVDRERGVSVLSSTIEGWRSVPLREIFEQEFSVPVQMEENTRTKTLAEKRFGAGRGVGHLMFIDFGPGIGCGVATPNGLFRGSGGNAGELGHTHVMDGGPVCRCGSYGCLETVASLPAIARRATEAIGQGAASSIRDLAGGDPAAITADHVFEAARRGDKLALGILDETSRYLGMGIANAVNLFNPEMVVFDARLAPVQDLLFEAIENTVKRQALEASTRGLRFAVSELGQEAGALGAAAMVLDSVFEIPQLDIPDFV
ncbi:MAG: ROK family protein [Candidatus Hydrogenedentes bacterium]|nr:ROK family protein [Candidatus Hydrogenedentota bacterium]